MNKSIKHEVIDLSEHDENIYIDSVHYNKEGHKNISKIISNQINDKLK